MERVNTPSASLLALVLRAENQDFLEQFGAYPWPPKPKIKFRHRVLTLWIDVTAMLGAIAVTALTIVFSVFIGYLIGIVAQL